MGVNIKKTSQITTHTSRNKKATTIPCLLNHQKNIIFVLKIDKEKTQRTDDGQILPISNWRQTWKETKVGSKIRCWVNSSCLIASHGCSSDICSFFCACRVKLRCARLSETSITMTHTLIARIPSRRRPASNDMTSQETDGHNWHWWWTSWLTHTYPKHIVNFFGNSDSSKFSRDSSATSACAKQKPIHCSKLKKADMDHAILPQEDQTDSNRVNLCQQDSERITKTTPRASNSGRPAATEDPSNEKKNHMHPNTEENTSRNSRILQTMANRETKNRTNLTIKCRTMCVQEGLKKQSTKFTRSTLRFGANLRATAYGLFILAYKETRRLQKNGSA